ncbi:MAG: DUF4920 domain-containing protein [Rhodothermales bacterium]
MRILSCALVVLLLTACQQPADLERAPQPDAYTAYGATVEEDGALPIQAVAAEPEMYTEQNVKVEGTIVKVCQMKGCWLTLDLGDGETVRVAVDKTEEGEYTFMFPKDISGRRVIMDAYFETKFQSVEDQAHFARDEGKTQEEIDAMNLQPERQMWLTAYGALVEKA